jgi:hypothetical protein
MNQQLLAIANQRGRHIVQWIRSRLWLGLTGCLLAVIATTVRSQPISLDGLPVAPVVQLEPENARLVHSSTSTPSSGSCLPLRRLSAVSGSRSTSSPARDCGSHGLTRCGW